MSKTKLGVIFGGMSTENEVSVISGTSILKNLNKQKYEIYPIYIDIEGNWYKYQGKYDVKIGEKLENLDKIENIVKYLKGLNIIFPVLHGLYGEDGTIQGLFELLKIPYVGCKVLASSIGMDKVYTKMIFDKAKINQTKSIYVKKQNEKYIFVDEEFNEEEMNYKNIYERVMKYLKFPLYVKPSNSGSSVGVTKAINEIELKNAIDCAGKYDSKILIEEEIKGKEVECAVLGNKDVIASCVGQIKSAEEFYTYDAKYNNEDSKTLIPANITKEKEEEIQKLAIKAFKAIDGKGLSRVDFFVQERTEKVYINEINTLPGFTNISMYPKLFENSGINYMNLLDKLIELAMENK